MDDNDTLLKKIGELLDNKLEKALDPIKQTLDSHTRILDSHTRILDSHTKTLESHTKTLDSHTKTLESHTKTLESHTKTLDSHTASLVIIENKIDSYGDMYKINTDNIKRHEERLTKIEDRLSIDTPPELRHVDYRE